MPVAQIVSAFLLVCASAMFVIAIPAWLFMAALSAFVLAIVTQTFRSFEFVVTTSARPDVSEEALRDVLRPRPMWSPHPVIRASVVESVAGSNLHIHQRPRLFWLIVILLTTVLFDATDDRIYAMLLVIEVATVVGNLWYTRWLIYRGENA